MFSISNFYYKNPSKFKIKYYLLITYFLIFICGINKSISQESNGPYIQQGTKMVSSNSLPNDYQGSSIQLSGDGNTAIVGTERKNGAFIYVKIKNRWVEQAFLSENIRLEDISTQGSPVGISEDGNTAIIRGYQSYPIDTIGSIWVYTRNANIWSPRGEKLVITGNIGNSNRFGSIAISGDGNTILFGLSGDNYDIGAVWVFTRINNTWKQQAKLIPTDNTEYSQFGSSVSISFNGNNVIVGGPSDSKFLGAAWIFMRTGSTWIQQGKKIIGKGNIGSAGMGFSVSISGKGNTAIIGGWQDNNDEGAAWVFNGSNNIWSQYGEKIIITDTLTYSYFGSSVEISSTGNTAVVSQGFFTGKASIFKKSGDLWKISGNTLVGSDDNSKPNRIGPLRPPVSVSENFSTILIAGAYDDNNTGAVWIFQQMPLLTLTSSIIESPRGQNVPLKFNLKNSEAAPSPASYLHYYLSNDTIYDATDVKVSDLISIPSITASALLPVNQTISLPAGTLNGKYFILPVLDVNNVEYQYNAANKIGSIPLVIGNPDLSIKSTKVSPTAVMPGDVVLLDCSVANTGTTSATASSLGYFLSTNDTLFDALDPAISLPATISTLEPSGVVTATQVSYKVPANAAPGRYTVFFVADNDKEVAESNEQNNVSSASFVVGAYPDLVAQPPVLSKSDLLPGESTEINFTVNNTGVSDAGPFQIKYFYSLNNTFESTDSEIVPSQNVTSVAGSKTFVASPVSFILPSTATAGTYYILCIADFENTVKESNESNNMSIGTIKVGAYADIKASPLVLNKASVLPLDTIVIIGSLSNAGGSAASSFDVQYYISSESVFNAATATPLFSALLVSALAAGAPHTLPVQKYIVPAGSKEGANYIYAILDKSATIAESDESNNVAFASFTVASLADLQVITPFASATSLLPGESSDISFEVINRGTLASVQCTLSFFLSASQEYKVGDSPVLTPVSIPALLPGKSFLITPQSYKMPASAVAGAYYIVAVADKENEVKESIESNNSNFVVLKVGAFADLFATNIVSSTSSLLSGDTLTLSGRIINFGSNAIGAYNAQYYLSTDDKFQVSDVALSIPLAQVPLAINGVNNLSKTTYKIPVGTAPGNYFLLLVADKEAVIKELDITNNVITTPLTIIGLPDFVISSPVVSPLSVFSGDSISISYNLENKGGNSKNPIVDLQYFLSVNDKYEVGDTPLSSSELQKSPASLSSVSIAAKKFLVPASTPSGAYYVIIVADLKYGETELSEVNNSTSVAVTVSALPDLSIASAAVTGAIVLPGDSIRVAATLTNGGSASGAPVGLAYYFSLDTKIDTSDKVVANITVPALAGLTSAKAPVVSYKVPLLTAPSNYYILIAADSKNTIRESNETNNLGQGSFAVSSSSLADYTIDAPTLSASSSTAGDTIVLGCTVKNNGNSKADKESFVQYFLSSDKVWDKGDVALGDPILVPMLAVNGSQIVPAKKYIVSPSTKAGGYNILFFADKDNVLFEANEANNTTALQIKVSERADLTITAENVSPLALYESDSVSIACTVENIGSGKTPLSVNLQYYLSADKLFDKDDKMLGNGVSIPTLASGEKFNVAFDKVKLPNVVPGNYFVLLIADNTNDIAETSESNNMVAVAVTLQAFGDLRIQIASANPAKVFPGDAVTFSATIQNIGKGSIVNPFRIQFFLSKNKTYELKDESISEPIAVLALPKTIPYDYTIKSTQPTGTYFVLVVVDAGNQVRESDESNNIYAIPLPIGKVELMDLKVEIPFIKSGTLLAGDSIEIDQTITNIGTEASRVCQIQFFLSTDAQVSNGDIALNKAEEIPTLNPITGKFSKKYQLPIPLSIKPGQYYLLSSADVANVLNENNEENNVGLVGITIMPFPDLQVIRVKASRDMMFIGDTTTLSATVLNASGSKTSKAVSFQYFLSSDRQFSKDDRALGNESVIDILDTLKQQSIRASQLTLPSELIGGFYYLLPVVDSKQILHESNEGNNTLPLRFTINPRPVIVTPDTLSLTPGSKDVIAINIKVKSELPVAKVNFTYRKLTDSTKVVSIDLPVKGVSYSGSIPKSFLDEIGAEYAFYAIDSSGNRSLLSQGSVPVEWPSPGLTIPYYSYGRNTSNYRMIAIPLNLNNKKIDVIMNESQGIYDKKKWRMYNYRDGATVEFTFGLDSMEAGKTYWFVAKDSTRGPILTGAGNTVNTSIENPYSIMLNKGWNQVGNPYNMNIYWTDLITYKKNNKKVLDAFYTYNGKYQNDNQNDKLASMEGAFVYATESTRLYFPTQKRTEPSKALRKGVSMNAQNWSIDFKLSDEEQISAISGLGMNTTANASKDELDALTPPRFLNYLELNFAHQEYVYSKFTRDIVPAADSYVWDFTIESEVAGKKTLSWNNSYFKSNAKNLVLYDSDEERVINMGNDSSYSFESGSVKHLSVYYGNLEFIEENLQPERITLSNPYPNPLSEKTNFTVSLPAGVNSYAVKLSIYNTFGQEVHTIANAQFTPGFYNFTWDGLDIVGNKQASGIYLIKLKVDAAGLQREMSRKVMVR